MGGSSFRFLDKEISAMEELWEKSGGCPSQSALRGLVKNLSKLPERNGNAIHKKQVQNWFTKKRYTLKKKGINISGTQSHKFLGQKQTKNRPITASVLDKKNGLKLQFEAKSSKDSAWYDVNLFLAHRRTNSGDPEIRVRFVGYGSADDEWVNIKTCLRERSLPCEASDCVLILPGDLTLCFKEGREHALHFDAYVLEVNRRRHDIRGCRCRFLVQYIHDRSKV